MDIKKIIREEINGGTSIAVDTIFKRNTNTPNHYLVTNVGDDIITFRYPVTSGGDDMEGANEGQVPMNYVINKIEKGDIIIVNTVKQNLDWIRNTKPVSVGTMFNIRPYGRTDFDTDIHLVTDIKSEHNPDFTVYVVKYPVNSDGSYNEDNVSTYQVMIGDFVDRLKDNRYRFI
jgi:hypothetical protein